VLPRVEFWIAVSILVVGLFLCRKAPVSSRFKVLITIVFASFHGWVHGAEMPHQFAGISYGLGFVVAAFGLMGIGLRLGVISKQFAGIGLSRVMGCMVTLSGFVLVVTH